MNSCVLRLLSIWMSKNAESICSMVSEKLRRPALHAFIKHCGHKSPRIARPNTLTDSYTWFLPKVQPFLIFMTRTRKYISNIITLPKYTVLIHWRIVYANLLLCWSTPFLLHCWAEHQQNHNAELYPILTHC